MTDLTHPYELNMLQEDPWRLFKIMSEFVNGFDALASVGPCVSIFGSTRVSEDSEHYKFAFEISSKIASKGFSIITGGGPGTMEAANRGAQSVKSHSIGIGVDLPFEAEPNKYIDPKLCLRFRYFFIRKVMLMRYSQGFVFLPGGFGTMDELLEIVTLIQTKKMAPIPIIVVGSTYWKGLFEWMRENPLREGFVAKDDFSIMTLMDDPDKIADTLFRWYQMNLPKSEKKS